MINKAGRGKKLAAHRVAYELAYGPIPEGAGYHGTCVLHRCDVPLCVNPAHLFLGTQAENVADMIRKGRQSHPGRKGEAHNHAKLTNAQVLEIRAAYETGAIGQKKLGALYGIGPTQVWRIVNRQQWNHLSTFSDVKGSV